MKKLIFIAAFLWLNVANAQDSNWWDPIPFNEKGLIEFVVDYDLPDKSKDEMYSITKVWLSEAFKSSKSVIEVDEKDAGVIAGNGNTSFSWGNALIGYHTDPIFFSFKCQMKDGKYRLTVNNIQNENDITGRNGVEYLFNDSAVKKNGEVKDYPKAVKGALLDLFQMLQKSIDLKLNEVDDF